ncbi:MAG: plasmid pRiA4b ORF-3 family protein [Acidimicrobiales bacterium]
MDLALAGGKRQDVTWRHAGSADHVADQGDPRRHPSPHLASSRRVGVTGVVTLGQFHRVLQIAMGWEDDHLHAFWIGTKRYGPGYDDLVEVDETTVTLAQAFAEEKRGLYQYDFGDCWEHRLLVEKPDVPEGVAGVASCTAGKRACPPEDCGGIWGYYNLLELADPSHDRWRYRVSRQRR